MEEKTPLLKIQRISFAYQKKEVLRNLSLDIYAGQRIGILGSSGSGKSTLLQIIRGRLFPESGELFFEGLNYKEGNNYRMRQHPKVSLMAQDFDLDPNLSADDNIIKAGRHLSPTPLGQYLGRVHRAFKMGSFKNAKVASLSGGQKQRVALAASLIGRSSLLLLDEPFSQLDYQLKQDILTFLQEESIAKAIVMVGHEPTELMRFCDHLIVLDRGRILQQGSVEEIYHYPKNNRVGELSGLINSIPEEQAKELGLKYSIFRPLHCRIHPKGDWELRSLSYHAFGQLATLVSTSGIKIKAQVPLEGDFPIGSFWSLEIKKPQLREPKLGL